MKRISFSESVVAIEGGKVKKTADGWLIKGAVLLSEFSKNKAPNGKPRRYLREALKRAAPLFDGLQVNVNHPPVIPDKNSPTGASVQSAARCLLNTIGQVINPRYLEGRQGRKKVGKIVGDLDLIECDAADHVARLAKKNPRIAGMSFTGDGNIVDGKQFLEVHEIFPKTVDAVHSPASTLGFFEGFVSPGEFASVRDESLSDLKKRTQAAKNDAIGMSKKAKSTLDHAAAASRHREAAQLCFLTSARALKEGDWETYAEFYKGGEVIANAARTHESLSEISRMSDEVPMRASEGLVEASHNPGFMKKKGNPDKPGNTHEDDEELVADDIEDEADADEVDPNIDDDGNKVDEDGNEIDAGEVDDDDEFEVEDEEGEPTTVANQKTEAANASRTSEDHEAAAFAHMKAAGDVAEAGGDLDLAKAHADKAREHEAVAERLKKNERATRLSPSPDTKKKKGEEVSAIEKENADKAEEAYRLAGTLSECVVELSDEVRSVYGI